MLDIVFASILYFPCSGCSVGAEWPFDLQSSSRRVGLGATAAERTGCMSLPSWTPLRVRVETLGFPHCPAQITRAERSEQRVSLWLKYLLWFPLVHLRGAGQCQSEPGRRTPKGLFTLLDSFLVGYSYTAFPKDTHLLKRVVAVVIIYIRIMILIY